MRDFLQQIAGVVGERIARWIRTIVPAVVTYFVVQWPAVADLFGEIDTTTITLFVFAAYYSLIATLETKVHPAFGWLLGRRADA